MSAPLGAESMRIYMCRGARGVLVTTLMLSWILAVCAGKKVGTWLSDISGAFDPVFKPYLLAELHGFGVGPLFLKFLDSCSSPRKGQVVVQGAYSDAFTIADSVFQGTVMAPMLWNSFFSDVGQMRWRQRKNDRR